MSFFPSQFKRPISNVSIIPFAENNFAFEHFKAAGLHRSQIATLSRSSNAKLFSANGIIPHAHEPEVAQESYRMAHEALQNCQFDQVILESQKGLTQVMTFEARKPFELLILGSFLHLGNYKEVIEPIRIKCSQKFNEKRSSFFVFLLINI